MTATATDVVVASSLEDSRAVEAVKNHHAELAGGLAAHVDALLSTASGAARAFADAREAAVRLCTEELAAHAQPEEDSLCSAAARVERARLAVLDGMHELLGHDDRPDALAGGCARPRGPARPPFRCCTSSTRAPAAGCAWSTWNGGRRRGGCGSRRADGCSYCGCRSITVIGRFSQEHDEIVNVAGALRRAAERADLDEMRDRAHDLGHLLHPHTDSEERGLFAELRLDPDFTEHVDLLCGEHEDLDRRLDAISAGHLSGVKEFVTALRRHIDREENGLFPAAAVSLDGPAWDRITGDGPRPSIRGRLSGVTSPGRAHRPRATTPGRSPVPVSCASRPSRIAATSPAAR